MKNIILSFTLLCVSFSLKATNTLQEQAAILFKEAIMPNDKGSVRFLHKTSSEYKLFGDCLELEDKTKFKEDRKSFDDVSRKYQFTLNDIPATYDVTCYEGYGGTEYIIDIHSENKELLEEIKKLTLEYFDKHLIKKDNQKYMLGVFETEVKEVKKSYSEAGWIFTVYMFNNAW